MTERLRIFTEHVPACRVAPRASPALKLVLPFEQRQKARQRVRVAGLDVGIQLPRGTVLRGGDRIRAADGAEIEIIAAPERVSTVYCRDLRRLAQVAYHLGNRHVALEIGIGWVRYLADHVLDALVAQLGLRAVHEDESFEPESGGYGHRGHEHRAHAHPRAHEHSHEHRPALGDPLHHPHHHHDDEP